MLEQNFQSVYEKFKLQFFRRLFSQVREREGSLSAMEAFSVEVIHELDAPTIGQFADFLGISQSNATYKVNNLIRKGYIVKENSDTDRREYHLKLSDKFYCYNGLMQSYIDTVMARIHERFTPEELATFEHVLAVMSDELLPEARITGFKGVTRTSFCHVLNARATAHKYAQSRGRTYEDMNLVVAHLGGGISISAHSHGRIIDSVSDDAGPFSPDRAGSLNMQCVVELCYSGRYTKAEMMKKIRGEGGMSALLGTHDAREIERRIQAGDEHAALVYRAQALQIAKGVGIMLGCFQELIDAVILTGGLAHSKMLTDMVVGYLHDLCRIVILPGENEMEALALGGLRILDGQEQAHIFRPACSLMS